MDMDIWTKRLKIIIITLCVIAYSAFVAMFLIDSNNDSGFPYIFYLWIIGGLLYIATTIYAVKTKTKLPLMLTIIITGTVWLFPPLIPTIFGIPFLIAYPWATGQMIFEW
jgi:hypothetical protein